MIESHVLGPKTGPERWAGYQTNFPPTTSGSMHCRRRYGDPELAGFCLPILVPHPNTAISVISPSYGTCHISMDRYLRDEYDYGENVVIGSLVTEKLANYFPYLEKTLCF